MAAFGKEPDGRSLMLPMATNGQLRTLKHVYATPMI